MSVIVVGLDQTEVPLEVLERVAVGDEALGKTLLAIAGRPGLAGNLSEVVVLSTCQRFEIYAVVDRFHEAVDDLRTFVAERVGGSPEALADAVAVRFDDFAVVHLFEVASGMRSTVIGEHEVLGQVRRAADRAAAEKTVGPVLSALFRRAVSAGRRVRSSTGIATGSASLSYVAAAMAARHLGGSLDGRIVVVLGAGEMGDGVVRALTASPRSTGADGAPAGAAVTVVNRTAARARTLAQATGASAAGLSDLAAAIADADAVIVTTGADLPVLTTEFVPARPGRGVDGPLVVVDLGMPRNVDPDVGRLPGVLLLDMDDVRAHVERTLSDRLATMEEAGAIIRTEVERYHHDARARGAGPAITALRTRLEDVRSAELVRARGRAEAEGEHHDEAYWAQLDAVSRAVVAKLLHEPTMVLKDTAGTPRGERILEALRTAFDF